jgi:hypothetical protein
MKARKTMNKNDKGADAWSRIDFAGEGIKLEGDDVETIRLSLYIVGIRGDGNILLGLRDRDVEQEWVFTMAPDRAEELADALSKTARQAGARPLN